MNQSSAAMTTWLGTLAAGGVLDSAHAKAGVTVAAYVVGEEAVAALRGWMAEQSADVVRREKRAAIEVCIFMANADRNLDPEEAHMLRQIVGSSGLDEDTVDELVAEVHAPAELDGVEDRLTHPTLRELMLALSWEMATADGDVDESEAALYADLAKRLGVRSGRADELRSAVTERLSAPPEA